MCDAAVMVEAVRPARTRGFFGLGKEDIARPPAEAGVALFLRTAATTGVLRLCPVAEHEPDLRLQPGEVPLFFLRVRTSSFPVQLSFAAAALDRAGRSLDIGFTGQWRLEDPLRFLQQGVQELVAPGSPLLNSAAGVWLASKIQRRVQDELGAAARDYEFGEFVSLQVMPLELWQSRLRTWLGEFGVVLELAEVRPACAEAVREEAARQQVEALRRSGELNQRIREALLAEAQLEAEFRSEQSRLQCDGIATDLAREQQMAELRIAYRERLLQAEARVQQLVREADDAAQKHLVQMAQWRAQVAEAELARAEREHEGELNRVLREQQQRVALARLEVDRQAILQAQAAQAQAFDREVKRQELLFQMEMEQLHRDLAHKPNLEEAERTRVLQQAQDCCDQARTIRAAADERVLNRQEETPKLAVLSAHHAPRYFEIVRPWLVCGREPPCHVVLASRSVSAHHCTVARVTGGWLVVDHASTNGSHLNGEAIRQQYLVNGDLLRVGDFWLLFALREEHEFQQLAGASLATLAPSGATLPRSALPSGTIRFADAAPRDAALLELAASSGQVASSDGGPILIGHGSTCTLRLTGGNVGRFHAVVFWDTVRGREGSAKEAGVYVEDLHSGRGLLLNGQAVQRAKLKDRDVLEIAGHRITVNFHGDVQGRAEAMPQHPPPLTGLAITCVEGPSSGKTLRLDNGKDHLVIGRDDACDLVLGGSSTSRKHAELRRGLASAADGRQTMVWTVADLGSSAGTRLNGTQLSAGESAAVRPGDILRLGQGEGRCDLLVHHNV